MKPVRTLLISTYDLGRQPLGLASPAARLRQAGVQVECVDTSRDRLSDEQIRRADLAGFYLPMHTATRLAAPLIDRVRAVNPAARIAAYGLYAPLNATWLRSRGVTDVLGPDADGELLAIAVGKSQLLTANSQLPTRELPIPNSQLPTPNAQRPTPNAQRPTPNAQLPTPSSQFSNRRANIPKLPFVQPDRSGLPSLDRYAALQMPDGSRRVVGNTDATRGCKHLCRHCPIVPVYHGTFRAVPVDIVLQDVRAQVAAGAEHISFGDPDFFNGPTHARRLVEQFAREFPSVTYDVTIKIEHLLKHADLLPLLRDSGCLFITSAVESVDDRVLEKLRKGHTRADFIRAVDCCRSIGITLSPTFVPFTPWTTVEGYADLLDQLASLDMAGDVAPVQLAIRLLVTADSALLELAEMRELVEPFDAESLTWPWRHADPRVDLLQREVMGLAASMREQPRGETFNRIRAAARQYAGMRGCVPISPAAMSAVIPPHLTEAWYCCAEPSSAEATEGKPTFAKAPADKPTFAEAATGKQELLDYL